MMLIVVPIICFLGERSANSSGSEVYTASSADPRSSESVRRDRFRGRSDSSGSGSHASTEEGEAGLFLEADGSGGTSADRGSSAGSGSTGAPNSGKLFIMFLLYRPQK